MSSNTKTCPHCGLDKPLSEFRKSYRQKRPQDCQRLCKLCANAEIRKHYLRRRLKIIAKLGGKCAKCGFADIRALQIDHVNGGGFQERKVIGHYTAKYMKRVLEDTTGLYQLLCANCNWIKRFENNE